MAPRLHGLPANARLAALPASLYASAHSSVLVRDKLQQVELFFVGFFALLVDLAARLEQCMDALRKPCHTLNGLPRSMGKIAAFGSPAAGITHAACTGCGLVSWCLPARLNPVESAQIDDVTEHRRDLKRGRFLFHAGDTFKSLYIVNSGSVKTTIADDEGRVQVTRFSLPGDLVGVEAIDSGKYPCSVIAMEDSSCCGIRYTDLCRLGRGMPALQIHLHRTMSHEITRDYGLMFLLGSMGAEERVAKFLLNLSARHLARGYSSSQFRLCMSRLDIASHLGLRLETVSRVMARLSEPGILVIVGREINVKNPRELQQILGEFRPAASRPATRH
jgi:CRP/FNR family transcriptional regulator